MRKNHSSFLSLSLLFTLLASAPGAAQEPAPAGEPAAAEVAPAAAAPELSPMAKADALYAQGKLASYKKALPLYLQLAKQQPASYEAQWKAARILRETGDKSKKMGVSGWKALCKKNGKLGMAAAEKAIALAPDKVEGHFFYGLSVGTYADGVSILTAVSEGLAGKTKQGFNKAYKINKNFEDGAPIKAIGRYWTVLPWPLHDRDLGIKYLREYLARHKNDIEGRVYLAKALLDRDDKGDKAEAKGLLEPAIGSKQKYYKAMAKDLWQENKLDK